MNRELHRMVAALVLAMVLVAPALADQEVNETVKAKSDGLVTVENIAGSITIVGWDRAEVKVVGTLTGDVEKVEIETDGSVSIEVKYPRHQRNTRGGADLTISVPSGSRVEVETVSADIDVSGVTGVIEPASVSGNVTVAGKCRSVTAESVSGDVFLKCEADEVEASSTSGRVRAEGGTSAVSATTVSGGVELKFREFKDLEVESVSGKVTVEGDLAADGRFDFELHSGRLDLIVPAGVDADFRIETFNGDIENAFGQKSRRTSEYAPGRELNFSNGKGSARVRIDTFSGDVNIIKQ